MRRVGGWTLGLVAVIGMAAAGFLGLRPILFRKPLVIPFVCGEGWNPQNENGVRLAFAEKGFRVAGRPIQPEFLNGPVKAANPTAGISVWRSGHSWGISAPASSPTGPSFLELLPNPRQMGVQAARWTQKKGFRRVFIPSFAARNDFAKGFQSHAGALEYSTDGVEPQGRSLIGAALESKAELILLNLADARIASDFRKNGYTGAFLVFDPEENLLSPPTSAEEPLLEGAFVASRIAPDLMDATGIRPSASPGPLPNDYLGYLTATLLLDAFDRTSAGDPWEIFHRLAQSPEFNSSDGSSALPGGLYIVENGACTYVERLK